MKFRSLLASACTGCPRAGRWARGSGSCPATRSRRSPATYDASEGGYIPIAGAYNSARVPTFHQLDLRVDKAWQFKDWRFSAYLDLYNAYNNQAVEGLSYNYNYTQETYQTGLPIIPSLGLRGEF